MAIDVRATVTCSLGTLISGNVADDYVQGNGLIKVRGSVEISGLITPAIGTAVTFAYKINGGTRNLPRKLRVLSSFADPFRRTTKVELGCKLSYLSDLKDKLKITAFDNNSRDDFDPEDADSITVPFLASDIMSQCLAKLGITASSNPLTNRYSVARYDMSPGYVSVLNDLLLSEGYCGYLDRNEVLQVFNLNQDGGTGPVVGTGEIIDIAAINAGQVPGEAVTVSYSTLKMVSEPKETLVEWQEVTTSNASEISISYQDPTSRAKQNKTYKTLETITEKAENQEITTSNGDIINVVKYRETVILQSSPIALGSVISQYLSKGVTPYTGELKKTTKTWFYYDKDGNEIKNVAETYASQAYAWGSVSLPMIFEGYSDGLSTKTPVRILYSSNYLEQSIETETLINGNIKKIVTKTYGPWMNTLAGQQAIAESRDVYTEASQVEEYMDKLLEGKYLIKFNAYTEESTSSSQKLPLKADIISQSYAKKSSPSKDSRSESKAEIALALGSPLAQRRIEFSLPLSPDDSWVKTAENNFDNVPSIASIKAINFGRIQNRLLLGNRSGMNLQLNAIQMPEAPFSPLVVQASGLSGLYRTNGTSWTFNAEGLVVSTDALFWGAVGGSGSFWFPVAPGVTSLPSTPATTTVDVTGVNDSGSTVTIGTIKQMVVGGVVAPYNETVIRPQVTRTRLVVESLPYSLVPVTTSLALVSKTKAVTVGVYPKTLALTTKTKLVLSLPPVRVAGTVAPLLGNGQVSPTSTATNAGWTLIYNSTADEAKIAFVQGFDIKIDGATINSGYITSNAYVTFANNNVVYDNLGPGKPSSNKIHIGADDFSYQRVYTKDEGKVFRIRWEGNSDYGASAGNSNRFFELNFWKPVGNTQLIEILVGNISGGTSGPFMVANGTTALASGTFAANESFVFEGNADGTSWALYEGEHVE